MTGDFSEEPTYEDFGSSFEKPMNHLVLMSRGNHDTEDVDMFDTIIQRDYQYYEEVGDVGIISLTVLKNGQKDLSDSKMADAIAFMKR